MSLFLKKDFRKSRIQFIKKGQAFVIRARKNCKWILLLAKWNDKDCWDDTKTWRD